jgi:hypothetical protein
MEDPQSMETAPDEESAKRGAVEICINCFALSIVK